MIQDFESGGYKMLDLKTLIMVQKLKWIKAYLNNQENTCCKLMEVLIKVQNLNVFLVSNFDKSMAVTTSTFYNDVLKALLTLNKHDQHSSKENLQHQFIFYNRFVRYDKKPIYDAEFLSAGIWKVADLFLPNGKILPFNTLLNRGISRSKYMMWLSIIHQI